MRDLFAEILRDVYRFEVETELSRSRGSRVTARVGKIVFEILIRNRSYFVERSHLPKGFRDSGNSKRFRRCVLSASPIEKDLYFDLLRLGARVLRTRYKYISGPKPDLDRSVYQSAYFYSAIWKHRYESPDCDLSSTNVEYVEEVKRHRCPCCAQWLEVDDPLLRGIGGNLLPHYLKPPYPEYDLEAMKREILRALKACQFGHSGKTWDQYLRMIWFRFRGEPMEIPDLSETQTEWNLSPRDERIMEYTPYPNDPPYVAIWD